MNISKRVVLLLLTMWPFVTAISCVESRNPLSDESTSTPDERLIGMWREEGNELNWVVERADPRKNALQLTMKDDNGSDTFVIFTTMLKSRGYMTIEARDEESTTEAQIGYTVCQYELADKDTLQLRFMDPDVIMQAIEDRQLRGEIKVTKRESKILFGLFGKMIVDHREPIITDSPEGIARYLEEHANECYPEKPDVYKRSS